MKNRTSICKKFLTAILAVIMSILPLLSNGNIFLTTVSAAESDMTVTGQEWNIALKKLALEAEQPKTASIITENRKGLLTTVESLDLAETAVPEEQAESVPVVTEEVPVVMEELPVVTEPTPVYEEVPAPAPAVEEVPVAEGQIQNEEIIIEPEVSVPTEDVVFSDTVSETQAPVEQMPSTEAVQVNQDAINNVQSMINSLPVTITDENYQSVYSQYSAIDEALGTLTAEEYAQIDFTNYNNSVTAYNSFTPQESPAAEETQEEPLITVETDDYYIQSLVWSSYAPAEGTKTIPLSQNGKLVAWYVSAQEQKDYDTANGQDYFTVTDDNGNTVTVYKEYYNTVYLYYYGTGVDDYVYFNSDMTGAFRNMHSLQKVSALKYIRTDYTENMSYMFAGDESLYDISALRSFRTYSLKDVSFMFIDCTGISNARETMNPSVYDLKAAEIQEENRNYLNLVNKYGTFTTPPYDPNTSYYTLSAEEQYYYPEPYEAWTLDYAYADATFSNTPYVTDYPDWFYRYMGWEVPATPQETEEVAAPVIYRVTPNVVGEGIVRTMKEDSQTETDEYVTGDFVIADMQPMDGYKIYDVHIADAVGNEISYDVLGPQALLFKMPASDVVVSVEFKTTEEPVQEEVTEPAEEPAEEPETTEPETTEITSEEAEETEQEEDETATEETAEQEEQTEDRQEEKKTDEESEQADTDKEKAEETEENTEAEEETEAQGEKDERTLAFELYEYDADEILSLEGEDFSSGRLMVITDNEDVIADSSVVISHYGKMFLLQFEEEELAKAAYLYYQKHADYVEVDKTSITADGDVAVQENSDEVQNETGTTNPSNSVVTEQEEGNTESTDVQMTEVNNTESNGNTEENTPDRSQENGTSENTDVTDNSILSEQENTDNIVQNTDNTENTVTENTEPTATEQEAVQSDDASTDASQQTVTTDIAELPFGTTPVDTSVQMSEENNPIGQMAEALTVEGIGQPYDIAVIDTGAELNSYVIGAVSVIGDTYGDDNGHGTEVVRKIHKYAPDAKILSVKALDAYGNGTVSSIYAAIQYAMEQDVRIINMSASAFTAENGGILRSIIEEAISKGIIFVGSAGNKALDASYFIPGSIEGAYIIGACDENGSKLEASNFGPTVDYNVYAETTSEAAAVFSGWISSHGIDEIQSVLNHGLIFETNPDEFHGIEDIPEYFDLTPPSDDYMNSELYPKFQIKPARTLLYTYMADSYQVYLLKNGMGNVFENDDSGIEKFLEELDVVKGVFLERDLDVVELYREYMGEFSVNAKNTASDSDAMSSYRTSMGYVNWVALGMEDFGPNARNLGVLGSGWTFHRYGDGHMPTAGDIVVYSQQPNGRGDAYGVMGEIGTLHVGFVYSDYDPSTGTYQEIAGNVSAPEAASAGEALGCNIITRNYPYHSSGYICYYWTPTSTIAKSVIETAKAELQKYRDNPAGYMQTIRLYYGGNWCNIWVSLVLANTTAVSSNTLTIRNSTYSEGGSGNLRVSKVVTGSFPNSTANFQFKLEIRTPSGALVSSDFEYSGSKSGVIVGRYGVFSLKGGESILIKNLPIGYRYTITEVKEGAYVTTTVSKNGAAAVEGNSVSGVIGSAGGSSGGTATYRVSFSNGKNYAYSGSKTGTSANEITLANGQSITFSGLPTNLTYNVSQTTIPGYDTFVSVSGANGYVRGTSATGQISDAASGGSTRSYFKQTNLGASDCEYFTAGDGTIAYCLTAQTPSPTGNVSYTYNGTASKEVCYAMYNGYPRNTTINGTAYSANDARRVTQMAMWIIGKNGFATHYDCFVWLRDNFALGGSATGNANYTRLAQLAPAAYELAQQALSYDGSNSAINNYAEIWTTTVKDYTEMSSGMYIDATLQTMVLPKSSNASYASPTGLNSTVLFQQKAPGGSEDATFTNKKTERTVTLTNKFDNLTGAVRVKKSVTGEASGKPQAQNQVFTFTLKVTNAAGQVQNVNYPCSGNYTSPVNGNNGTFTLKCGQECIISGIPQGYKYTITESTAGNVGNWYITRTKVNSNPAYQRNTATGTIPVNSDTNPGFVYQISFKGLDVPENVSYTGSRSGSIPSSGGSVTLYNNETITLKGLPTTCEYTITETQKTSSAGKFSKAVSTRGTLTDTNGDVTVTNTFTPTQQEVLVENQVKPAWVRLKKTSGNPWITNNDSHYSLEGAEYAIFDSRENAEIFENPLAILKTNANGETDKVKILPWTTYYLREVKSSPGYKQNDEIRTINPMNPGDTPSLQEVDEEPYEKTKIRLEKVIYGTNRHLGTAEFTLYELSLSHGQNFVSSGPLRANINENNASELGIYTSKGYIYASDDNPQGMFVIDETKLPDRCIGTEYVTSEATFEPVPWTSGIERIATQNGSYFKYYVTNIYATTDARIYKYCETTPDVALSQTHFEIYEYDENEQRFKTESPYVMEWKDDPNSPYGGYFHVEISWTFNNLGRFYWKETQAQTGYELPDPQWETFTLNLSEFANDFYDIKPANNPVQEEETTYKGTLTLVKTKSGSIGNTNVPVNGDGTFRVYAWNPSTQKYDNILPRTNGKTFMELVYTDGEYKTPLPLIAYVSPNSIYYNEGKFKVVEEKSPSGLLIRNGWSKEFRITSRNKNITEEIGGDEFKPTNYINSYQIEKYLIGSDIQLNDVTFEFTKGNRRELITTGENTDGLVRSTIGFSYKVTDGVIYLEEIEPGVYTYKEYSAPVEYALDTRSYTFEVDSKGLITDEKASKVETFTRKLYNTPAIKLNLVKTETEEFETTVNRSKADVNFPAGTTFVIYEWSKALNAYKENVYIDVAYDGNKFVDINTGDLPLLTYSLDNEGKFKVFEVKANEGYIKSDVVKEIQFAVQRDNSIHYTIWEDGEVAENGTYSVKLDTEFENTPNMFTINKTDERGYVLGGAAFRIENLTTREMFESTTDADGIFRVYRLKPGTYRVTETQAPAGYMKDENSYKFIVLNSGKLQIVDENDVVAVDENNNPAEGDNLAITVTVKNPEYYKLRVTKQDSTDGSYYENYTKFPSKTVFELYEWSEKAGGYVYVNDLVYKDDFQGN